MISWWCVALERPWSWAWIPYPGIWAAAILPMAVYTRAVTRRVEPIDRRKMVQFIGGMLVFWIASDWPLGTLGAGYLASAHVTQFLLYTLIAAPLLLLGTPEWMARRVMERLRAYRATKWLAGSLVTSAAIYNLVLVATHAPGTVDVLRRSQFGSFAMDAAWLLIGFVLWMPIVAPVPELRSDNTLQKIAYLFVTTSIVAIIPASYLTFTEIPIYAIYELAPRVGGWSAGSDQQLAGIIMKLGTIPPVWGAITVMWFRWANREMETASA